MRLICWATHYIKIMVTVQDGIVTDGEKASHNQNRYGKFFCNSKNRVLIQKKENVILILANFAKK